MIQRAQRVRAFGATIAVTPPIRLFDDVLKTGAEQDACSARREWKEREKQIRKGCVYVYVCSKCVVTYLL